MNHTCDDLDASICPVCLNRSFEPFIDFGVVPVSGIFLNHPEDACPRIPLSFEFCTRCAVIRRIVPKNFVCDYRETIHTTGHRRLPYAESMILPSLREMGIQPMDRIIEVGANDGRFLDLLRGGGFNNLAAVEPSAHCGQILQSKGFRVWQSHFDSQTAENIRGSIGPVAAVFCRHTLEHVARPDGFVSALASLLAEDGILFIEVPDAARITENLHGYILWDEHLYNYFSNSLTGLLGRCGLEVIRSGSGIFRTVRTLLCWAQRGRKTQIPVNDPQRVEDCRQFAQRWNQYTDRLHSAATLWPRPIACLGASHPQTNFLNYTGLGSTVSFLVDDDPAKVGRFVPMGAAVPVISSEQMARSGFVGTILRTAFGCDEWMDRICRTMKSRGCSIVDPAEHLSARSSDHSIRDLTIEGELSLDPVTVGQTESTDGR